MKLTEKIIIILGLLVEAAAIGLIFCFVTSCKAKRQTESKSIEKNELVWGMKTEETAESSLDNALRITDTKSIERDISAVLTFFRLSVPDSTGNQYVTVSGVVDFSDKSKVKTISTLVDSTSENVGSFKIREENLKGKAEIKQETKVKSELKTSGFRSIVVIAVLAVLVILIIKNESIWTKAMNLLKMICTQIKRLF